MDDTRNDSARQEALDYHEFPKPGKLEIRATKPLANGRDLSRAYSPGVAEACLEIKADPSTAARYTSRGNLVAVVTNGTAVLGLGNIGALASKPVMEGKAVLFKRFADVDAIDIELMSKDADEIIQRILLFDGHPNVQRLGPIRVGENAQEMLALGLEGGGTALTRRGDRLAHRQPSGSSRDRCMRDPQRNRRLAGLFPQAGRLARLCALHFLALVRSTDEADWRAASPDKAAMVQPLSRRSR